MRNLTIQREKSGVACLGATTIAIEHPQGDITIDGVSCRILGKLKNGETKTFVIDDFAARVFAFADKLSKDWCFDVYQLDAGYEDLFLAGKHTYAPFSGNPFRFHNNNSTIAQEGRKKSNKRSITVIIVCAVIGGLIGYFGASGSNSSEPMSIVPQTFENAYFSITLTESFDTTTYDGFDACYESNDVLVLASRETFDGDEEFAQLSLTEYGQLIIDANELGGYVSGGDGLVYFSYTEKIDGDDYNYDVYLYKSDDAFWMIQFVTFADTTSLYQDSITQWAKSVTFQ